MTTVKIEGNNRLPVQGRAGEPVTEVSRLDDIKVCPYRHLGCVSEERGLCFNGICDPLDETGERFHVRVTEAHGQKFYAKVYDRLLDAEEIQRARVQSILARQDEPLPTWRHRQSGCTITEEAL